MKNFEQINPDKIQLTVDKTIYNESVISKALYWLMNEYFILQENQTDAIQHIVLEKKTSTISGEEFLKLKNRLNQDFIDFKVRDIINQETKNIRDILYIKAFSNNDEFADYNLIAD